MIFGAMPVERLMPDRSKGRNHTREIQGLHKIGRGLLSYASAQQNTVEVNQRRVKIHRREGPDAEVD